MLMKSFAQKHVVRPASVYWFTYVMAAIDMDASAQHNWSPLMEYVLTRRVMQRHRLPNILDNASF